MLFEQTPLHGSGKEIIQRVLAAEGSQLLIPPMYTDMDLEISAPPQDGEKYVGLFSSGTTGTPKCIWNKMKHLELNARLSGQAFEVGPSHFCLMMAKPWHVAGFSWMLMAEFIDCEYVFVTTYKGDHDFWVKTIQDINPDYLFTVPSVLRALYDEYWFVDNLVFGGSSIQYNEYDRLSPHCKIIYQGYGQTEAGGLISYHKRKSTVIPELNENLCYGNPITGVRIYCEGTKEAPAPVRIQSATATQPLSYNTGDWGYFNEREELHLISRKVPKGGAIQTDASSQSR